MENVKTRTICRKHSKLYSITFARVWILQSQIHRQAHNTKQNKIRRHWVKLRSFLKRGAPTFKIPSKKKKHGGGVQATLPAEERGPGVYKRRNFSRPLSYKFKSKPRRRRNFQSLLNLVETLSPPVTASLDRPSSRCLLFPSRVPPLYSTAPRAPASGLTDRKMRFLPSYGQDRYFYSLCKPLSRYFPSSSSRVPVFFFLLSSLLSFRFESGGLRFVRTNIEIQDGGTTSVP